MKKNFISLREALSTLGIAKDVISSIGEYAIIYYSLKYHECTVVNFPDADACFNLFQDICLDYCSLQNKDKSLFVDFPNAISDGHNEDFGNMIVIAKDNQIEEVYELVNPEYYE